MWSVPMSDVIEHLPVDFKAKDFEQKEEKKKQKRQQTKKLIYHIRFLEEHKKLHTENVTVSIKQDLKEDQIYLDLKSTKVSIMKLCICILR